MFAYRWLLQFERIELIHGIGSCFFIKMREVEDYNKIYYTIRKDNAGVMEGEKYHAII